MFVDWRHDFTDRSATVPVTVAGPREFAAEATRLGIGATTTVVAYDDYRNVLAGRIVWVLRSYGHHAAFVLDGGLGAWRAAGLPLEPGRIEPAPAVPPHPVPVRLEGLIDLDGMRRAIELGAQMVDARKELEYAGGETHARRAGHIPGALNVPHRSLLADDGTFLEPDELRDAAARGGRRPRPAHRDVLQRRRVGDGGRACRRAGRGAPSRGLRRVVERVGEP